MLFSFCFSNVFIIFVVNRSEAFALPKPSAKEGYAKDRKKNPELV